MRFRLHHPMFAGLFGVIALLVVSFVLLVDSGLRDDLIAQHRDELARELTLAAALLTQAPADRPDSVISEIRQAVGHRITIIGRDGVVLGDSEVLPRDVAQMENYADRPEVAEALAGGAISFDQRTSATLGIELLYGATVVGLDDGTVVLRMAYRLDQIDAAIARSQRAVAVAGLIAMLLALAAAYGASRALARPLTTLAERATSMAQGDLAGRAPRESRIVELDDLLNAFNRLADELQARLTDLGQERDEMDALINTMAEGVIALTDDARILRVNKAARSLLDIPKPAPLTPVRDLVEYKKLRKVLESTVSKRLKTKEVDLGDDRYLLLSSRPLEHGGSVVTFLDVSELRRLEQVRSDFVANASHELKTPLTAIRGWAETLLEDDPPEDLRREFLTFVHDNTVRLQELVNGLLDLSRLESGGWIANAEPVMIERMAVGVWDEFANRADEAEVTFEIFGEAEVLADRQGVAQVFYNLYDNAIRHSPDGGRLTVRISSEEGMALVSVADSGIGVPPASLPRIFERFYRADSARARAVGGTGLGLAIVRHLVLSMGGEVRAESGLDEGTTIRFSLPLAPVEAAVRGSRTPAEAR